MPMEGKIVTLQDINGNIFPQTTAKAVYMSNGKTVEEAIKAGGGGGTGTCSITFEETSESIVMNNPDMISKISELDKGLVNINSELEQITTSIGIELIKYKNIAENNNGDWTKAIDKAIEDYKGIQNVLVNGGKLLFPPYSLSLKSPLIIPKDLSNFTFSGFYNATELLLEHDGSLIEYENTVNSRVSRTLNIENMILNGNSRDLGADIVRCIGHDRLTFRNLLIKNIPINGKGMNFDKASESSLMVFNNIFDDIVFRSDTGISCYYFGSGVSDFKVYNGESGGNFGYDYAILMESSSSVTFYGGHYYNAKKNVLKMVNGWGFYKFFGTIFDNAKEDIIHLEGSTVNGLQQVYFIGTNIQAVQPNYNGILLKGNVKGVRISETWWIADDVGKNGQNSCVKEETYNGYTPSSTMISGGKIHSPNVWLNKFILLDKNSYVKDVEGVTDIITSENNVVDYVVTSTNEERPITTVIPNKKSNYLIYVFYKVINAETGVEFKVYYGNSGGQTYYLQPNTSKSVGQYAIQPVLITADTTGTVRLIAKSTIANNLIVSAYIKRID